ncbi:MAG: rRNA maturation RNase YbeY [Prevotellaceae bacterium]|jgi:rRNA maturation RNase YbeY|nr:rRNA maturation RNase YbeY [Prevotellaceae bacterium]
MIAFHFLSVKFKLPRRRLLKSWLKALAEAGGKRVGELSVIFCSDEELLSINRRYLQHDYFTDIITFDYSHGNNLSGDMFISYDTVCANAHTYRQSFDNELHRVMAHGLLHLCGYRDATAREQKQMRSMENKCLKKWDELFAASLPPASGVRQ